MRIAYAGSTLVGMTGLEPAASWSQTKHSTKLSYIPKGCTAAAMQYGAPDRTRICGLGSRSPLFYPAKLQAHVLHGKPCSLLSLYQISPIFAIVHFRIFRE